MKATAAVAALCVTGCATPVAFAEQVWTPDQLKQHARENDGKTVLIKGWLPFCEPTACTLFESKSAWESFQVQKTTMLSIARNDRFDHAVQNRLPGEALIRVRVKAICIDAPPAAQRTPDDLIECIQHRPSELIPLRLLRLTRAPSPPTRT